MRSISLRLMNGRSTYSHGLPRQVLLVLKFGPGVALMEFNTQSLSASFLKILSSARKITGKRSYFTFLIGLFLISSKIRPYFYVWYSYFRWVDDLADSHMSTVSEKQLFINRQEKLIKYLYRYPSGRKYDLDGPEVFLTALIPFDKKRGSPLKKPILDLLSCISFDVNRVGIYPEQQQLSRYIELEVTSYLKTFRSFCCPEANLADFPRPWEGIAGKWTHIIRDLVPDLKNNIINISREDQDNIQIKIVGQHIESIDPALRTWVAAKVRDCEIWFQQGKQNLLSYPELRYKTGIAVLCAKYEYYLNIIEKNGYQLKESYSFDLRNFCSSLAKLLRHLGTIFSTHFRNYYPSTSFMPE